MSWRDRVSETGSFRGAVFYTRQAGTAGGRRNIVHEFPLQEMPYTEDLGRSARQYNLELYVIGPDYMDARDALINALEAVGAGTLVHPWLGSVSVVVVDYRLTESTAQGGMATFTVSFAESGEIPKPTVAVDTASVVSRQADMALEELPRNDANYPMRWNLIKRWFSRT
jgi:prophage DNA circulation protein